MKTAQHVDPTFPPLAVLSPDQIKSAFRENSVQSCSAPELCHLNVNSQLYRGLGPFTFQSSCNETVPEVNKINAAMDSLGRFERVLKEFLTPESFYKHQQEDPDTKKYIDYVQKNGSGSSGALLIESGILKRKLKSGLSVYIVPLFLIPFVLAEAHWMSHSGAKKLTSLLKLQYWWRNMTTDIAEFVKGCILCSIYKANTKAKNEIGVPRQILRPKFCWQIDICSGLTKIDSFQSFLCIVDMYSGYVVPVALKNETSATVALAIEHNIIKPFGVPAEISSDNAANLNGPEVVKLCKFYNINRRLTTPYSPESHGLVEVCNKLLVQLVRIFGDQFKTGWLYVLTLAAVIMNSLPRLSLQEKSPYYLMFNEEPGSRTSNSAELLDMNEYIRQSCNNKNFAKLVREFLVQFRKHRNRLAKRQYRSFPPGSLIYVRDFSKSPNKKLKPIYQKAPQKVVAEYNTLVYAKDLLNRVKKHSKNNIKLAGDRSVQLFGSLPPHIQLVMGGPMDEKIWNKIKETGTIPAYLDDIELEFQDDRKLRGYKPHDTHLLEAGDAEGDVREYLAAPELHPVPLLDDVEDEAVLDALKDNFMDVLKEMHSRQELTGDNLTLADVEKRINFDSPVTPPATPRILAGLNADNILPEGTRRRVRFNV